MLLTNTQERSRWRAIGKGQWLFIVVVSGPDIDDLQVVLPGVKKSCE